MKNSDSVFGCIERIGEDYDVCGWVSLPPSCSEVTLEFSVSDVPAGEVVIKTEAGNKTEEVIEFCWMLPESFRHLPSRSIVTAQALGYGALFGSLELDARLRAAMRYRGIVSEVAGGALSGFARDFDNPGHPVILSVFSGTALIAVGSTGTGSLSSAADGFTYRDAFVIGLPPRWLARPVLRASVVVANVGKPLKGSPVYLTLGHWSHPQTGSRGAGR